ncbi:MAG: Hpt domain-containing protein, partial [Burkholderiales bacterium]
MSAETTPIATPLSWLKSEIDRSLDLARAALARTLHEPLQRAERLAECVQPVSHIRGALQMLNLEGAARFCSALEQAVQGFAAAPARLNELTASVMDRALFALSQFLDDLDKGEADVPLKLFPMYRELGELCERGNITENELFFPDVSAVPVHARCPDRLDDAQRERHVSAARARFQRGLVGWLRQPNDSHALQAMRGALDTLDLVGDQLAAPVGTWWVAAGLIDLLLHDDEDAERAAVKPILVRLERLMRDVGGGGAGCDASGLMRDMLYRIAAAAPLCARVCDIKSLYKLDAQLPEFCLSGTLEYDVSALAPVLEQMRQKLLAMEEAWARYAAGSGEDLQRLRAQTAALKSVARDLGHYRLVRLLDIVGLIALKLPEAYPLSNEVLALEMAAALLFMEGMLEHFTSPPADIDQQVSVMVGWLLDALKPSGVPALGIGAPRDDITQRQHYAEVRAQVAREILTNLKGVEQTVDEIARDPVLRSRIGTLEAPVRQIAGALKMLGLSRANGVLSACLHLMRLSASADASLTRAALEWVADGLSCLGFYLDNVCHGETPNEEILLGFVQRLSRDDAHPAGSISWIPTAADAAAAHAAPSTANGSTDTMCAPPPADSAAAHDARELRAVYFGEARDVLAELGILLSDVRAEPENAAVVNAIRRAFHTLKGGARLVGLDALAELAWEVEQTLDVFLDAQWPAGDDLPVLIGEAMETIGATVQALEQGLEPDVAAYTGIVELAAALREPGEPMPIEPEASASMAQETSAFDPATAAQLVGERLDELDASAPCAELETCAFDPDMGATQAPAAIDPVEEEIAIGAVRLSRTLYEIYLGESEALLETVRAEIAQWGEAPAMPVPDGLVRAAHTLRSTASTLGFDAVAALATELEDGLLRLCEAAFTPDHRDALEAALNAL